MARSPVGARTTTSSPDHRKCLFAQLSTGEWHNCGLTTIGTVACWGADKYAQAKPPGGQFSSVSAGLTHTCGVRINGSVACWGSNEDQRGNTLGQATPPQGTFTHVSAGGRHSCGVNRRLRRLLGQQRRRPGHTANGNVLFGQCWTGTYLWIEDRWLYRLLGRQRRWPGHSARRPAHLSKCGFLSDLRGEDRWLLILLGRV